MATPAPAAGEAASPARGGLSVLDGVVFVVGIVIGVGLFRTPSVVAAGSETGAIYLGLWALGGLAALIGALCYAELGSAYPDSGGEYHYLRKAYGRTLGLFFVWARGTVIQTGAVAVVAFVYGDYANQLLPAGPHGPELHGASAVILFTLLNLSGREPTRWIQHVFTGIEVMALVLITAIGLWLAFGDGGAPPPPPAPIEAGAAGGAMIFILLTYGGWNEAAYLSGEMKGGGRSMARMLLLGVGAVTLLYLAVNAALLAALGLQGLRDSEAVAADLMRLAWGEPGAALLSLIVCAAALSTMNVTIFTGARLYYALGRDAAVAGVGEWNERRQTPATAVLLQGAVALALVAFGAVTRGRFQAMVDYTAPVFWLFMLLTALALIVLRRREPEAARPFRVPLYPLTPWLFVGICGWLLYSSLVFTGLGALLGLAVLVAGIPFVLLARKRGEA